MPQSLSNIVVHLVFSTKHRQPLIDSESRPRVHAYLSVLVRNLGCECYRVGGIEDHVHLAVRLARTITIAELIEKLKTRSGKWIKTQRKSLEKFSWQHGYAALSISQHGLADLNHYITNQEAHHRKLTFQEEYRALLNEYGIPFDERYMWD